MAESYRSREKRISKNIAQIMQQNGLPIIQSYSDFVEGRIIEFQDVDGFVPADLILGCHIDRRKKEILVSGPDVYVKSRKDNKDLEFFVSIPFDTYEIAMRRASQTVQEIRAYLSSFGPVCEKVGDRVWNIRSYDYEKEILPKFRSNSE